MLTIINPMYVQIIAYISVLSIALIWSEQLKAMASVFNKYDAIRLSISLSCLSWVLTQV